MVRRLVLLGTLSICIALLGIYLRVRPEETVKLIGVPTSSGTTSLVLDTPALTADSNQRAPAGTGVVWPPANPQQINAVLNASVASTTITIRTHAGSVVPSHILMAKRNRTADGRRHPGITPDTIATKGENPIASVAGSSPDQQLWVAASGGAWAQLPAQLGCETYDLTLEPGGDIYVSVAGPAGLPCVLRVQEVDRKAAGQNLVFEDAICDGTVLIRSLPAAELRLSLVSRIKSRNEVLDEQVVKVGVDSLQSVTLSALRLRPNVPLSGSLEVRLHGIMDPGQRIRAICTPLLEGGMSAQSYPSAYLSLDGNAMTHIFPSLPIGSYEVEIQPYGMVKEAFINDAAPASIEFDTMSLPPLFVRVLDGATGALVPSCQVLWSRALGPDRGTRWALASAEPSGEHVIRSMPGLMTLRCSARGYGIQSFEHLQGVEAGAIQVLLTPKPILEVSLRLLGRPYPASFPWWESVRITGIDTTGIRESIEMDATDLQMVAASVRYSLSLPGKYLVEFGAVSGCDSIAPATVEVGIGAQAELAIELRQL